MSTNVLFQPVPSDGCPGSGEAEFIGDRPRVSRGGGRRAGDPQIPANPEHGVYLREPSPSHHRPASRRSTVPGNPSHRSLGRGPASAGSLFGPWFRGRCARALCHSVSPIDGVDRRSPASLVEGHSESEIEGHGTGPGRSGPRGVPAETRRGRRLTAVAGNLPARGDDGCAPRGLHLAHRTIIREAADP